MVSFWIYFKIGPLRLLGGKNVRRKKKRGAEDGFKVTGLSKLLGWCCA